MVSLNKKKNYKKIAKSVIDLEIKALKKLKNSINNSFNEAVESLANCQSKVILCGVGKSGLIAAKIAATLSSVGTPSFSLSANDCSHGDLGSISKKDVLILISYSGSTEELKNIIKYANRNRITLIGIMSKKNSILYKASDIKLLIPEVTEAGLGIVPTSSTINQLSIGDALAVAVLNKKDINKKDFKRFHPSGNLGAQLRTVEELMIIGNKIPFVNENLNMKKALQIISKKKLGTIIVQNNKKATTGIITDGQIRRFNAANNNLQDLSVKKVMTKNPVSISQDTLAEKALSIMNVRKITSLCVHKDKNTKKTIGILHIHNILQSNIH
jgi:arabinose-5-phosphate isomerase